MSEKGLTWEEFSEKFEITPEEEAEIQLEVELIEAEIEARKKAKLSQRELSRRSRSKTINNCENRKSCTFSTSINFNENTIPNWAYIKSSSIRKNQKRKITIKKEFPKV